MTLEAFLACDAATSENGKLNILGAFDALNSRVFPAIHPYFCIAARVRFSKQEAGQHNIKVIIESPNAKAGTMIAGNAGQLATEEDFASISFVYNFQMFSFESVGRYKFSFVINDTPVGYFFINARKLTT